jgi:DNA-binding MarR family transcriptional regulator
MKLEKEISQKKFKNEYHKAMVNIIFTYNWLVEEQIKLLKPHNITLQQFNILRILRGQHPNTASIKIIRERMLDKMSDVSRLVEKLRAKEFVERKICPADRRHVDVLITEKGLQLLSDLDEHDDEMQKLMSQLSSTEVATLNDYLDKLRS